MKQVEVNRARSAETKARKKQKKQESETAENGDKKIRRNKKKQEDQGTDLWNYEDK